MSIKRTISFFMVIAMLSVGLTFYVADGAESSNAEAVKNALVLYDNSSLAIVGGVVRQIDANNPNVRVIIKNNRSFLPVRFIVEALGASVSWNEEAKRVTVTKGDTVIKLTIGDTNMSVGDTTTVLDAAPFTENDRTYLPVRALSEAFGKKVIFDRGLIILCDDETMLDTVKDRDTLDSLIGQVNNLPFVGSMDNFVSLMKENNIGSGPIRYMNDGGAAVSKGAETAAAPTSGSGSGGAVEHSDTNVQVAGVDEADIVKNDGEFIYKVNSKSILIVKAYPASEMKVISQIKLDDASYPPNEIFINGNKLIIIGRGAAFVPYVSDTASGVSPDAKQASGAKFASPRPYYNSELTKVMVYDVSDKANPKKIREIKVEGNIVSSRMIGTSVYFVTNRYLYYYADMVREQILPYYSDSVTNGEKTEVGFDKIRYFPSFESANYMMVCGFDLSMPDVAVAVSSYLGAGNNVYVSGENMYIAAMNYGRNNGIRAEPVNTTSVYKFSLKDGKAVFLSKGEVFGNILNQFSMDEYNGYFRIATTSYNNGGQTNNLFVLDSSMNTTGKIEDIAPGERIYSVRFMGNKGYVVTFKQVDPLFAIDLGDPQNPKILGALKIPGYSTYLHPYDDTHIIGFGMETVVNKSGGVRNMGLKMAIFDVSDITNPKEMFTQAIGDAGTTSPLLNDHKALLFDKNKGVFAFPVTIMEAVGARIDEYGNPTYGTFKFQGALVYDISLDKGFVQKGKITQLTSDDMLKSSSYGANQSKYIDRIIYIGDNYYTLSSNYIAANDMQNLEQKAMVQVESENQYQGNVMYAK